HVLDAVGTRAAPAQQVADKQALLRRGNDTRHAGRLDQVTSGRRVFGNRGLNANGEGTLAARQRISTGLELLGLGNDFAHAARTGSAAPASFELGDDLLRSLKVRLKLALLDEELVHLGASLFGHLLMRGDFL